MSEIKIPHVVNLEFPVEHGDDIVEKVTFNRRPTTGDMRGVKLDELTNVSQAMTVVCRISDFPVALKNKLDAADGTALIEAVVGFLDTGR